MYKKTSKNCIENYLLRGVNMKKIIGILLSLVVIASTLSGCGTRKSAGAAPKVSRSIINSNSKFAFDIFKKLNSEDSNKNIFISPFSISAALTMTYNGAETTTKEAMAKALGFDDIDRGKVNEGFKNLLEYFKNNDKKVELNIANSIWVKDGEKINGSFISSNKSNFNAKVDTLDFSKDSAADTINKWISDSTKGKIDKMVDKPIDPDVVMYLINAIYFKGQWSQQFDPKSTRDGTFKAFDGNNQNVKMMNMNGKVQYKKGDKYKVVRLPYGSGKISMYCILPDEGININDFIENMNNEKWNDIRKNIPEVDDVMLGIPKFRLEYGIKNLNDSLSSLGMGEAFSDKADFSGIENGVYISRVLHKAVINVDETGSEAAASTVVEATLSMAMNPVTFIADRPFAFIIADDTTGTILFMGKLLSVE